MENSKNNLPRFRGFVGTENEQKNAQTSAKESVLQKKGIFYQNGGFYVLIVVLLIIIFSSVNKFKGTNDKANYTNQIMTQEQEAGEKKEDCKCSDADVNRLVYKIEQEFTQSQNELESQYARVIRKYSVEKRENCSWVVIFKISWPYGNTDGAHPDEFVKKRFLCDGKEIYTQ